MVDRIRRRWITTLVVAAAIGLMATGSSGPAADATISPSRPRAAVFAMLANHHVLKVSLSTGAITARVAIRARGLLSLGHVLAIGRGGHRLYALDSGLDQIVALDPSRLRVRRRFTLPPGLVFDALAIGPKTGRLYAFGNRVHDADQDAVLAVLDPKTGSALHVQTIRQAQGRNWSVFDGAIDPTERYALVSYHGGCPPGQCTSGADWLNIDGSRLLRCTAQTYPNTGCLSRVHGDVVPYRGGVVATTGGGPLVWLALDGHTVRAWETGLPGNHLTQVALTPTRRRAYLVGSCGYAGGFSTIDLGTGKVRTHGRPSHAICGERVAAARSSRAVIAKSSGPTATILVVDASRGGRVVHSVRVPADVVDVLSCVC